MIRRPNHKLFIALALASQHSLHIYWKSKIKKHKQTKTTLLEDTPAYQTVLSAIIMSEVPGSRRQFVCEKLREIKGVPQQELIPLIHVLWASLSVEQKRSYDPKLRLVATRGDTERNPIDLTQD